MHGAPETHTPVHDRADPKRASTGGGGGVGEGKGGVGGGGANGTLMKIWALMRVFVRRLLTLSRPHRGRMVEVTIFVGRLWFRDCVLDLGFWEAGLRCWDSLCRSRVLWALDGFGVIEGCYRGV